MRKKKENFDCYKFDKYKKRKRNGDFCFCHHRGSSEKD